MSNETFLAVAIVVVISTLIGLVLGSTYTKIKTKKENDEEINITLSKIMSIVGDLTIKIYNIYADLGGIDADDYNTDKEYRAKVVSETISYIIELCGEYGIEVTVDKSALDGIACLIIENILNKYTIEKQEAEITLLNNKLDEAEETDEATEVIEEPEPTVSVSLGNFYED